MEENINLIEENIKEIIFNCLENNDYFLEASLSGIIHAKKKYWGVTQQTMNVKKTLIENEFIKYGGFHSELIMRGTKFNEWEKEMSL